MDAAGPHYRIRAVSEMTGVATATLRAWERRYGFPSPSRSDASYRLYSGHDVDRVKRMQALVDGGLAPSEAAKEVLSEEAAPPEAAAESDVYEQSAARIVQAARLIDTNALSQEIRRALLLDSGLAAFRQILRPALVRIGEMWHAGEISVAGEHAATHLIATAVLDLVRLQPVSAEAPRALLACFPDEHHGVPLYGAALELATWGYRPIVLGPRTPAVAIARGIEALAPAIVGLSVTVAPGAPGTTREIVDGYGDAVGTVPWIVGGAAANAMRTFIEARGGHVMPDDPKETRALVDRLVRGAKKRSTMDPVSPPRRGKPKRR